MSSKGITEKTAPESPPRAWSPSRESAPSILREEQPTVARIFGLVGLMLITIGCAVLATVGLGYSSRIPPVLGAFLLSLGLHRAEGNGGCPGLSRSPCQWRAGWIGFPGCPGPVGAATPDRALGIGPCGECAVVFCVGRSAADGAQRLLHRAFSGTVLR